MNCNNMSIITIFDDRAQGGNRLASRGIYEL